MREPRRYASKAEAMWLGAERRAWERVVLLEGISAPTLPSPGFPTALTEEEPAEGPSENGGVEVLYSHPSTTLRFLDPFRIVEHELFAKQVYPDLRLSNSYPLGTARRHQELRNIRHCNRNNVRISFNGIEIQGFADATFIESSKPTAVYDPTK